MNPKFSDVTVKLVGEDGNAFSIMSRVRTALIESGYSDHVDEYLEQAKSGDYDNLLRVTMATVNCE